MKSALARCTLGFSISLCSYMAWAHSVPHQAGLPWWQQWNFSAIIVFNLTLMTFFYLLGLKRIKRRGSPRFQLSRGHKIAYVLALATLVLALLSPIDVLSESLSWVHMVQHSLLMMVAAPLLVLAAPGYLAKWSLPPRVWQGFRRLRWRLSPLTSVFGPMAKPIAIWTLYSLTLWIWHIPRLYQAALQDSLVHDIQHLAFFVAGFLFWGVILNPFSKNNLGVGTGILYLFFASLHSMTLGILMALSPMVWYPFYDGTTLEYGLTPLQDQQIAGYIMWMPAGITYVVAAVYLLTRLFKSQEQSNDFPAVLNKSS